jgi:hypothetical protein
VTGPMQDIPKPIPVEQNKVLKFKDDIHDLFSDYKKDKKSDAKNI